MINYPALFAHDLLSRSERLLGIEHVHGPQGVPLAEDDVVLVCLVRDGAPYIEPFLRHHFALGVRHVALLDNDSTDDSVERAARFDNVTILKSARPYKYFRYLFKDYLVRRFGGTAWSLCVDVDEFFEYPWSDSIPLRSLAAYLNHHSYTAVVCQLLDRFPMELRESSGWAFSPDDYPFYDVRQIRKERLPGGKGCVISNPDISAHWGGARGQRFSLPDLCLTKCSLLKTSRGSRRDNNNHWAVNARIADFSTVLMHYKFTPGFFDQVRNAVREKQYYRSSREYRAYMRGMSEGGLDFREQCTSTFAGVSELLANGFLAASDQYRAWAQSQDDLARDLTA